MTTEPKLVKRDAQHYIAVRTEATMQDFASVIGKTFPVLFEAAKDQGITQSGPEFIRYIVVDMDSKMQVEMGFPVANAVSVSSPLRAGILPAGTYATVQHTGHYDGLMKVTGELFAWAGEKGITWKTSVEGDDMVWEARVEFYLNDPSTEPDPEKWETELAFLTAD